MNEPVADDFDISTNFLSGDELSAQVAADDASAAAAVVVQRSDDAAPSVDDADAVSPPASASVPEKPDKRSAAGKKQSIQAEIDAHVTRRETAKREADAEEARLATVRSQGTRGAPSATQTPEPVRAQPAAVDDPEPVLDAFATEPDPYTAWSRAVARWEARQEWKTYDAQRTKTENERRHIEAIERQTDIAGAAYHERLKAEVGDLDVFAKTLSPDVIALKPFHPNEAPTGKTAIADSILASSIPAKLLLHFSQHPEDLVRIGSLSPHVALREVGILEGTLRSAAASHGPASTAFRASAASPPTKPLGGSPSVSPDRDDDADDTSPEAVDRYIRRQNSKDTARRTARR